MPAVVMLLETAPRMYAKAHAHDPDDDRRQLGPKRLGGRRGEEPDSADQRSRAPAAVRCRCPGAARFDARSRTALRRRRAGSGSPRAAGRRTPASPPPSRAASATAATTRRRRCRRPPGRGAPPRRLRSRTTARFGVAGRSGSRARRAPRRPGSAKRSRAREEPNRRARRRPTTNPAQVTILRNARRRVIATMA